MGRLRSIAEAFSPWLRRSLSFFRRGKDADPRHQLGRRGERLAARELRRAGYKVLYRNFRPRRPNGRLGGGEVDIVCRHGETLVFVEVKTRSCEDFAAPLEGVSRGQQRRVIAGALQWLRLLGNPAVLVRFDVVEVLLPAKARPVVRIVECAFSPPESFQLSGK